MSDGLRLRMCKECSAGIYWVTLQSTRAPHPVDMLVAHPPMVGLVAVNERTGGGRVLTGDDVETGRALRWIDEGVSLHASHFASCPAAQAVRDRNPDQEQMDV